MHARFSIPAVLDCLAVFPWALSEAAVAAAARVRIVHHETMRCSGSAVSGVDAAVSLLSAEQPSIRRVAQDILLDRQRAGCLE